MPKQKTRKSVLKRFKITKTGKVLYRGSFSRHLNSKKTSKRKRHQRKNHPLNATMAKKVKKLLMIGK